ncbi:MAG: 2-dehydropantoate 2-reductase [Candidatus Omnitrophica bacterium]|nr:2-dehydropantoate 2-reductase [Candidatus Omnitrophota bacterium]
MNKIAIIGPGAIGSLLAASLARKKKVEVWLLDKHPRRARKLLETGIRVESTGSAAAYTAKVNVSCDAKDIGPCGLIVCCVKSYDTAAAVKDIAPLIGDDTSVLSFQNGLGNWEILAEAAGSERVLAGSTAQAAMLRADGQVVHTGSGETIIGRPDGKMTVAMRSIRDIFGLSGWPLRLSKDITAVIWSKLILNVGINAVTALTRLPNGALPETEPAKEIIALAVAEAVQVAKKQRVKLLYDDPVQKVESLCRDTAENFSSMLQDILKRRRTEIEYINGAIVRLAKNHKTAVPANTVLSDLVRVIESSYIHQVK